MDTESVPSLDLSSPLSFVDRLYSKTVADGVPRAKQLKTLVADVTSHFKTLLSDATEIPCLNSIKPDDYKDGMLVRYRGMVQDMFESEIFLADFPRGDGRGCGLFRDALPTTDAQCGFDPVNGDCGLLDRQSFYCVPVPAETAWVKDFDQSGVRTTEEPMKTESQDDQSANLKRVCEDEDEASKPKKAKSSHGDVMSGDETAKTTTTTEFDLNFPLADEKGPAVIVKIYDPSSDLKVCDLCQFVGILSVDPVLAAPEDDAEMFSMETSTMASTPSASLVPRLHVVAAAKIAVDNPLLPPSIRLQGGDSDEGAILKELVSLADAAAAAKTLLTTACGDDALAAEYLLCHLVSAVHSRRDLRPIGKMSLNLSGCSSSIAPSLHRLFTTILPAVDLLPLTLDVLNGKPFVPVKNYDTNRLMSSRLQLGVGTEVVIDETALSPGQLNEKGVRNLTILGTLIQWQKLDYDFKWTTQEFPTSLRLLVVSEGKSILPSDFQVPLQGQFTHLDTIHEALSSVDVNRIRRFLSLVQVCTYTVDPETQKMVEEDFVNSRADDEQNMTVDDFERLLTLSRYVTILDAASTGGRLTVDIWNRCKRMEDGRKSRLPARQQPHPQDPVRVGVEQ